MSKVVSSSSYEKTSPLNSPKLRRRLDSFIGSKVERRDSICYESTTETLSELFSRIATEERKQSGSNTIEMMHIFQSIKSK